MQGFELDFSELREYTHGFFSHVAEILEEGVVPVWFNSVDQLLFCNLCMPSP